MQLENKPKKRVMLTVAYDGSHYKGWQIQPGGITIESELIRAFAELTGEKITITGASRTDAGVHALCNKAVFDTATQIPAEKLSYAMNRYLPEDIRIRHSCEVAPDFHPRRVPGEKTYAYRIYNAPFPDPTKRLYSYFVYVPLDVEAMKEAAGFFLGTHDFAAISTYKPEVASTVRTITDIRVEVSSEKPLAKAQGLAEEKLITITVTGNGFLYHMVRILAGTLLEVGRGRMQADAIPKILASRDRNQAGPTAPAMGLMMTEHRFLQDSNAYNKEDQEDWS
ncbi:MAG: tRNA pseudouridine(38-40) synthase TruA [Lachnospiraceae bacterium]|nr:tRNA pseudouridine(38-40) synthase TruA [Lachnospiraceae bacterium]